MTVDSKMNYEWVVFRLVHRPDHYPHIGLEEVLKCGKDRGRAMEFLDSPEKWHKEDFKDALISGLSLKDKFVVLLVYSANGNKAVSSL